MWAEALGQLNRGRTFPKALGDLEKGPLPSYSGELHVVTKCRGSDVI